MTTLKTLAEAALVAVVLAIVSVTAILSIVNPSAGDVARKASTVQAPVFYGSR
ncbi:MAG: hypothetical protein QOJ50_1613 [Cryptosporangiaceae bacterium]|nr:hypothetical protein [Cryptosporangiaceae bacterium]